MRRLWMILILTVMPRIEYVQVYSHMISTMYFILFMVKVKPYISSFVNKVEAINDVTVLVATYPLFVFTPWVHDLDQ